MRKEYVYGVPGGLSFPVAFAAGLVSFFSPCVLPLVPSYISVISGVSYDDLRHQTDRNHTLRRTILAKSLLFILGFAVVFVALGTSFTLLGQALSEHREIITKVGGVLIIFFGLYTAECSNSGHCCANSTCSKRVPPRWECSGLFWWVCPLDWHGHPVLVPRWEPS